MTGIFQLKTRTDEEIRQKVSGQIQPIPAGETHICVICGRPATHTTRVYRSEDGQYTLDTQRHFCPDCAEREREKVIARKIQYHRQSNLNSVYNAEDLLEKRGIDMYAGRPIWDAMEREADERTTVYGSKYEAAADFLLRQAGISAKIGVDILTPREGAPQHRNELDLYVSTLGLPALDIEIDGELHDHAGQKDYERDREVMTVYPDLTVLRIDYIYLTQSPQYLVPDLLHYCRILHDMREYYRPTLHGALPSDYLARLWGVLYKSQFPRAKEMLSHEVLYLRGDPEELTIPKIERVDRRALLMQEAG